MNTYLNQLAEYYGASGTAVQAPTLRVATAGEVFGALSQRAADAGAVAEQVAEGFSTTVVFHAAVLLLLVCYAIVLYRHPELLASLREYIFSPVSTRDERLNDNRHDPLRGFSWGYLFLGVLFFCTAAVRAVDMLAPEGAAAVAPPARLLAIPLAAGVFLALLALQHTLLALTGTVTVSRQLTTALTRVKTIYYRLTTATLTPILLLWALLPAGSGRAFVIIIALQLFFVSVAFLRETFLLFISKKLSIYHWILYLCTVEAFPVSFVWLLAARG